ncbi:MAG TPA: fumarylacetoacetate hydrolase family protein [Luteibaculaceae bacterium]|nr:fumarylacetoacetate hydrolase family protein [Luteibaculaceae bacterium]
MKIICIGRNYAEHAKELNNDIPEEPLFFLKPETALIPQHHPFIYPDFTSDLHYECELVLRISRLGKHIEKKFAHKYYAEIGIGIDFTARDLQQKQKAKGLPWEIAKAFDHSAPVSQRFLPVEQFADLRQIEFSLRVNGEVRQLGNTRDLIFDFDTLISHVSKYCTLKIGDLLFTGTPEGVGPVRVGDRLECFIGEEKLLVLDVK